MIYLIVKMLALLLIAGFLGGVIGWLLRGARDRDALAAREREEAGRISDLRRQRDEAEAALAAHEAESGSAERVAELERALADCETARDAAVRQAEAGAAALRSAEAAPQEIEALSAAPIAGVAADEPDSDVGSGSDAAEAGSASDDSAEGSRPQPMSRPADGGDDLRQISGIGPKLEELLHELGIWRFRQIADFTAAEIAWVDERLQFKGRIEREEWAPQAKRLAEEKGD